MNNLLKCEQFHSAIDPHSPHFFWQNRSTKTPSIGPHHLLALWSVACSRAGNQPSWKDSSVPLWTSSRKEQAQGALLIQHVSTTARSWSLGVSWVGKSWSLRKQARTYQLKLFLQQSLSTTGSLEMPTSFPQSLWRSSTVPVMYRTWGLWTHQ